MRRAIALANLGALGALGLVACTSEEGTPDKDAPAVPAEVSPPVVPEGNAPPETPQEANPPAPPMAAPPASPPEATSPVPPESPPPEAPPPAPPDASSPPVSPPEVIPPAATPPGMAGAGNEGGAPAAGAGGQAPAANNGGAPEGGRGGNANNSTAGAGGMPTVNAPPEGAYVACSGAPLPSLTLTPMLEDLDRPVYMATPERDANTWFVVERGGQLLRFDMTQQVPVGVPLLEVMTSTAAELGFLSMAIHPNFDGVNEQRIYVAYNPTTGGRNNSVVDEFIVEGDSATFSQTIFQVVQPARNHNGGSLVFGPDGYLYYGSGDGGGSNDNQGGPNGNGQDPNTSFGKILRYDVDNLQTPPAGNLTSADVGGGSVDSRVLHLGLRNPWRFSFDQLTGDLYIGDVGQHTWEEVSMIAAGTGPTNFGWAAREGFGECPACGDKTLISEAVDPIFDYASRPSGNIKGSVTGGYVYRGSLTPQLYGRYIFGDYVRGTFYVLTADGNGGACDVVEEAPVVGGFPGNSLASFAQDASGEVYSINMSRGEISRIGVE